MKKQIKLLTWVLLCNCLGRNEAKYGKDPKKKNRLRLLGAVMAFLGIMLVFYIGVTAWGFASLGFTSVIPAYVFTVSSVLILFFTIFKAGDVLFHYRTYERLAPIPVRPSAIVISRFLSMYLLDFALSLLILIPGLAVYAFAVRPGVLFYFLSVISLFLTPLLALTLGAAIGAIAYGVSARLRHKNLISIVLLMLLTIGLLVGSFVFSFSAGSMDEVSLASVSAAFLEKLGTSYPPAYLFSAAITDGNIGTFFLFAGSSLAAFILFVMLVGRKLGTICRALGESRTKGNYVLRRQRASSFLKALWGKELRRYFASPIYVMNTLVGPILALLFSGAVLVMGVPKLETILEMPNLLCRLAPVLLGAFFAISPTTSSAISIEGKQWWILKTIPVPKRTILGAKLLVEFTFALPAYVLSELFLLLALKPDLPTLFGLLVFPLAAIFFSSVAGLYINLKLPVFDWETETQIVKQSAAVGFSMLAGFLCAGVCAAVLFALGEVLFLVSSVLFLALSVLLYVLCLKMQLPA